MMMTSIIRNRPFLGHAWLTLVLLVCCSCATNPVTGHRELRLISPQEEISLGQENFAPSQQLQGGPMVLFPEVGSYVAEVGRRLAAVSDRPELPYEFVVVDSGEANAWALPGGKIAVHRALLTELDDEAELAAVLGHEIVHATAGHSAQAMQRGTALQLGLGVLSSLMQGSAYSPLYNMGANLGSQLVMQGYSRAQESEADHYGMLTMQRAGYDPTAAVDLQKTFVHLFTGHEPGVLGTLFQSHPPSVARVLANQALLQKIGAGGLREKERYHQRLAALFRAKPAYDLHAKALANLAQKDYVQARQYAAQAAAALPQEALFPLTLGDIAMAQQDYGTALDWYSKAATLNRQYFLPSFSAGVAAIKAKDTSLAQRFLQESLVILPTPEAHYLLGRLALQDGSREEAIGHLKAAAQSEGQIGQAARALLARMGAL